MSHLLDTTPPATTETPAPGAPVAPPPIPPGPGRRSPMRAGRKTALAGGIAYLLTFVFSIPTLGMKGPLDDPAFVLGAGSSTSVVWACLFDVLTAFAGIATAVALYPVARRQSVRGALGFVTSRVLEASLLVLGAICLMSVVTLRQDPSGSPATLVSLGHAFIAAHDWAFLFGPGVMSPITPCSWGR